MISSPRGRFFAKQRFECRGDLAQPFAIQIAVRALLNEDALAYGRAARSSSLVLPRAAEAAVMAAASPEPGAPED